MTLIIATTFTHPFAYCRNNRADAGWVGCKRRAETVRIGSSLRRMAGVVASRAMRSLGFSVTLTWLACLVGGCAGEVRVGAGAFVGAGPVLRPQTPGVPAAGASVPGPGSPSRLRPPEQPRMPDPEAQTLFLRNLAGSGALVAAPVPPRVAKLGLDATARGEAPGMTAVGPVAVAALAEGGQARLELTLDPGECDTFVAQGALGVVEVDLFFTVGQGAALRVVAEDASTGPVAVLGGRQDCLRNDGASPLASTLHVQSRRGAGLVVVGRFRRLLTQPGPASGR